MGGRLARTPVLSSVFRDACSSRRGQQKHSSCNRVRASRCAWRPGPWAARWQYPRRTSPPALNVRPTRHTEACSGRLPKADTWSQATRTAGRVRRQTAHLGDGPTLARPDPALCQNSTATTGAQPGGRTHTHVRHRTGPPRTRSRSALRNSAYGMSSRSGASHGLRSRCGQHAEVPGCRPAF